MMALSLDSREAVDRMNRLAAQNGGAADGPSRGAHRQLGSMGALRRPFEIRSD